MNSEFEQQFQALISKYSELLIGKSDNEIQKKVQVWALYTYIAKSMPSLAKHWNELYPDAKQEIVSIIGEIKQLNEQFRSEKKIGH